MIERCAANISDLSWATPSALKWLETVFSERWGGEWYLTKYAAGALSLRPSTGGEVYLSFSGGAFPPGTSDVPCGAWSIDKPWQGAIYSELPTPGLQSPPAELIKPSADGFMVSYDIPGLIFWALTRSEEINRSDLDRFGRFSAKSSHAKRYGYLQRPLVDEWLYVLAQVADVLWPGAVKRIEHPAIALSHDVDLPARYSFATYPKLLRRLAGDVFLRRELLNPLMAPIVRMGSAKKISAFDPHNQFEWMMDVSESVGLRSSFYFICGRTNPSFDSDYEIEHPAMRNLMRSIHSRGHEIGLHPSFETFCDSIAFTVEAERLRRVCAEERIAQDLFGSRMHYLRWKNPDTLQACLDARMAHDATLGYPDEPGFRCGTCIEYQAFDRIADAPLPLRLRPLVAMEASVIEPNYLDLGTGEKAYELLQTLKKRCGSVAGTFSLLWHNSSLTLPAQRRLYKKIVTGENG